MDFVLDAFFRLSTCRPIGAGGVGPIPWDRVADYAERYGLSTETADLLVEMIRAMDSTYLDWSDQESKKNARRGDGHEPGSGPKVKERK